MIVPDGERVVESGDSLVVIGSPSAVFRFGREVSERPAPTTDDSFLAIGGGTLGYRIARLFEARGSQSTSSDTTWNGSSGSRAGSTTPRSSKPTRRI